MDINDINQRLERIYTSISCLKNNDLSVIKPDIGISGGVHYAQVDFNGNKTQAELVNSVFSMISNIATLKDHLKTWCSENTRTFEGDNIINSNKHVAIVHDLDNKNKHPNYSRPRSGSLPRIIDLQQSLSISTGSEHGSYASFSFDPLTRQIKSETGGAGSVLLVISGVVVSEKGERLGDLVDICSKATTAWENEFIRLGIV